MSWFADPGRFLRRSHRKGDADHQEIPSTSKPSKDGGKLRDGSLFVLMQSSRSNSLEKSTEDDDDPFSHGKIEESTLTEDGQEPRDQISSESTDFSPRRQSLGAFGRDLSLIRQAAAILIANVPSPHGDHDHERQSNSAREDGLQSSPLGVDDIEGTLQHANTDDDASYMRTVGHAYIEANVNEENAEGERQLIERERELPVSKQCADRESKTNELTWKSEEIVSSVVGDVNNHHALGHDLSLGLHVNSDNEADNTDESECKVISEDPAALARSSQEGNVKSSLISVARERKRNKQAGRKLSKGRNSPDQALSKERAMKKNSVSSRKTLKNGDAKNQRMKIHESMENDKRFEEEEDAVTGEMKTRSFGKGDLEHPSISGGSTRSLEESTMSAKDSLIRHISGGSFTREPTFNSKSIGPPVYSTERQYMTQESFAFDHGANFEEQAHISIGWDGLLNHDMRDQVSSTFSTPKTSTRPSLSQLQADQIDWRTKDERPRANASHVNPKHTSRRGQLAVDSPSMLQHRNGHMIDQESASARVASDMRDVDVIRSPYVTMRATKSPVISPTDEGFLLQKDQMLRETSRRSLGQQYIDLHSRRDRSRLKVDARDPWLDVRGDPFTLPMIRDPTSLIPQEDDMEEEEPRTSVSYEILQQSPWRRPQHIDVEDLVPSSARFPAFSLQERETMKVTEVRASRGHSTEPNFSRSPQIGGLSGTMADQIDSRKREARGRISTRRDSLELESRRQSHYINERRDFSLLQTGSSQHFYPQDDADDLPSSPLSAHQASMLVKRRGLNEKYVSSLPISPSFLPENHDKYYQSSSPFLHRTGFLSSQKDQQESAMTSDGEVPRPITDGNRSEISAYHDFYFKKKTEPSYMHEKFEDLSHERASSYHYKEFVAKDYNEEDLTPLEWQRINGSGDHGEAFYEEDHHSMLSFSRQKEKSMAANHVAAIKQHIMKKNSEKQLREVDNKHQPSRQDIESFIASSTETYPPPAHSNSNTFTRTNALAFATASMSPTRRSQSSEEGGLQERQTRAAEARQMRSRFAQLVVEMVGCAGEDAVHDLLDLEDFVDSYESLSRGGLFKLVVDQFFHELCCELSQPVSQENDSVLCTALFRLEQMNPSSS
ncbi:hypothetical protein KP509_10G037600 [Ceratopteris richardii]|uniref:Uncharacterized protein n=1 Tax=Ceratopteris richardii TaxID=49495 RepID=A0A8T2TV10_CERRI|nr:hypothetical protein KP509_10G037600 [Ceratopteris richardii]